MFQAALVSEFIVQQTTLLQHRRGRQQR